MSRIVAVVGTIAGAGATTTVTALGTALAEQRRRVALVDATAEGSRLADVLDVEGGGDLADALRRGTAVPDVQGSGPHDVAAFPAAPETGWGSMRPDAVATLYDQLRERFEFVLVDCGSDLSPARSAWLGHADEVLIVTDPDVAGAVPETAALAGAFDVPVRGVLANRVPPKEVGDAVEALEETELPVLGVLPEDPTVGLAGDAGDSVLRTEPDSPIATVAWELALRFRQRDHDEPVVPFGRAPPTTADADGPTPEQGDAGPAEDDPTSEPSDPTAGAAEQQSPADDATADAREQEPDPGADPDGAEDGNPADSEVVDAADSEVVDAADPEQADSADTGQGDSPEPEPVDPTESPTSSQSGESEGATVDDDPFTSPDPLAVEDADDESDEVGDGASEAEGGTAAVEGGAPEAESGASEAEGGASTSEPSGSLLNDVRAHIGDRASDDRASGSRTGDGSERASDSNTVGGSESTDLTGSGPDDEPSNTEAASGVVDDRAGSTASSGDSPGVPSDGESDADGTDEDAALSDEEIESLFAETMERVKGRQDSNSDEEDA